MANRFLVASAGTYSGNINDTSAYDDVVGRVPVPFDGFRKRKVITLRNSSRRKFAENVGDLFRNWFWNQAIVRGGGVHG